MKILAVAVLSLLCAGCSESPTKCRDEVAAAFERLRTSGRPYRKETVYIVRDQQTYRETAEFVPPDRMRQVTSYGVSGSATVEFIRVGARAWDREWSQRWRWREWEPGLAQDIYRRGAGMDVSVWPDRAVPENAVFECLGRVVFKGTAYIGYRAKLDKSIVTIGPVSKEDHQKLLSKFQQMPQLWRTVFLDWRSTLPAHDLVAEENQLDNPASKVEYTYPGDIKIDPPDP